MDFNLSTSEIMLELIRKMVSTPEAVSLTVRESASGVIYHIAASPEDMGAIIGKGRTARSLRILLHSIAMKHGQRIILDIGPKNEADQI
jgi:predicted RNA-binding protein YlqC (UPF0109 family)